MHPKKLLNKEAKYVARCFKKKGKDKLCFHNFAHTRYVVKQVKRIIRGMKLPENDVFVLLSAAWFYDTGYLLTGDTGTMSAFSAQAFLEDQPEDKTIAPQVASLLTAVYSRQKPQNLPEEILSDAVQVYLAKRSFWKKNELCRKETAWLQHRKISKAEWMQVTLDFMEHHTYYTSYCRAALDTAKQENLHKLRSKLQAVQTVQAVQATPVADAVDDDEKKKTGTAN
ncbi:HD domain-containing protein [Deminuibacter soli]|uniref:HD domain-containing protein n=1 Tax=Deminuibacter soli TaxID=2291815 RepID=A0A3E1NHG3_9BACT|nr:hypothetical protein [Deminuibacter soli]RFM27347.1 hypothetical protein DXN05_15080 [Deminuibacter soli]